MSYKKAKNLLPPELVELIQDYIEGEYIYIPKKAENKKAWGENTNTRKDLLTRNKSIYREYKNGQSTKALATQFYLSEKSIQRIVRKIKTDKVS